MNHKRRPSFDSLSNWIFFLRLLLNLMAVSERFQVHREVPEKALLPPWLNLYLRLLLSSMLRGNGPLQPTGCPPSLPPSSASNQRFSKWNHFNPGYSVNQTHLLVPEEPQRICIWRGWGGDLWIINSPVKGGLPCANRRPGIGRCGWAIPNLAVRRVSRSPKPPICKSRRATFSSNDIKKTKKNKRTSPSFCRAALGSNASISTDWRRALWLISAMTTQIISVQFNCVMFVERENETKTTSGSVQRRPPSAKVRAQLTVHTRRWPYI